LNKILPPWVSFSPIRPPTGCSQGAILISFRCCRKPDFFFPPPRGQSPYNFRGFGRLQLQTPEHLSLFHLFFQSARGFFLFFFLFFPLLVNPGSPTFDFARIIQCYPPTHLPVDPKFAFSLIMYLRPPLTTLVGLPPIFSFVFGPTTCGYLPPL